MLRIVMPESNSTIILIMQIDNTMYKKDYKQKQKDIKNLEKETKKSNERVSKIQRKHETGLQRLRRRGLLVYQKSMDRITDKIRAIPLFGNSLAGGITKSKGATAGGLLALGIASGTYLTGLTGGKALIEGSSESARMAQVLRSVTNVSGKNASDAQIYAVYKMLVSEGAIEPDDIKIIGEMANTFQDYVEVQKQSGHNISGLTGNHVLDALNFMRYWQQIGGEMGVNDMILGAAENAKMGNFYAKSNEEIAAIYNKYLQEARNMNLTEDINTLESEMKQRRLMEVNSNFGRISQYAGTGSNARLKYLKSSYERQSTRLKHNLDNIDKKLGAMSVIDATKVGANVMTNEFVQGIDKVIIPAFKSGILGTIAELKNLLGNNRNKDTLVKEENKK